MRNIQIRSRIIFPSMLFLFILLPSSPGAQVAVKNVREIAFKAIFGSALSLSVAEAGEYRT